jgi:hypothetical protein
VLPPAIGSTKVLEFRFRVAGPIAEAALTPNCPASSIACILPVKVVDPPTIWAAWLGEQIRKLMPTHKIAISFPLMLGNDMNTLFVYFLGSSYASSLLEQYTVVYIPIVWYIWSCTAASSIRLLLSTSLGPL